MLPMLRSAANKYPRQFWVIFWGVLISTTGSSMIWPFMAIYIRERLGVPLTTIALLMTLTSVFSLLASFIAGPITDRVGRKGVMLTSLVMSGLTFLLMSFADTLWMWALIMILRGCFNPLYSVGADAMIADLTLPEDRPEAYSLIRMIHNAAIAIGPTIGGLIAGSALNITFYLATAGFLVYAVVILLASRETLPRFDPASAAPRPASGYGPVLRDHAFLAFAATFTVTIMGAASMFVLLSVYAKENFALPESQYGIIMAANAIMVVLFQFLTTRITRRFPPLPVLAVGSLFYALGLTSVTWGSSFVHFLISMLVMSVGELIMMPTGSSLTANMAPPELRGRYMSIYGLNWGIGVGVGPIITGFLNDNVSPQALWYGAGGLALISTLGFLALILATRGKRLVPEQPGS